VNSGGGCQLTCRQVRPVLPAVVLIPVTVISRARATTMRLIARGDFAGHSVWRALIGELLAGVAWRRGS
jgi:hypothetical protein